MAKIQESGEMYLETIYVLSKKGPVRSTDVAERMGYSKPSISIAIKNKKYRKNTKLKLPETICFRFII